MPGWRFIRPFVYMSRGSIVLIAAALGWVITSYLTRSMLEREKTLTIDYVERIMRRRISPTELRTAHPLRAESTALQRGAEELSLYVPNGPGVPPDAAARLLQPFFTTKTHGIGLGLIIAKKIIDAHGGHLTLEAHVPHGTKATVWLPGRHHPTEETIL